MKFGDQLFAGGGTINPDYDVSVPELRVRYRVGNDDSPDAVLVITVSGGEFQVDDELRSEFRNLLLDSQTPAAQAADIQVREAHVKLMGPIWYDIALLLGGAAISPIVSAPVEAGMAKLKEKLRPKIRTAFNSKEFDENEMQAHTPVAEQQVVLAAKGAIAENFDVDPDALTLLSINMTSLRSPSSGAAMSVFHARDGSTFSVIVDYDATWRAIGITRSHPS
jgi:hypothetical protein